MKKRLLAVSIVLFVLFVVSVSTAGADMIQSNTKAVINLQPRVASVPIDSEKTTVGGQIFFRWQDYVSNGSSANVPNFDIDRAYIDVKKKFDSNANARITLDAGRITGASKQNLFDFLKYAYVEFPSIMSPVMPMTFSAKFGLQQTVWIDFVDKMLGLRYVSKALLDNEGVMPSSDFGVGVSGKIFLSKLPEIEYQATIMNGPGYSTGESDASKAIAGRLNTTLIDNEKFGKLILAFYGNVESMNTDLNSNLSNKQGGAGLAWQTPKWRFFAESVSGTKSGKKILGNSLGTVVNLYNLIGMLPGYSIIARADSFDPDSETLNDERYKSFYGIAFDVDKDVKLALDWQNSRIGGGGTTSIFYLQSMINL